MPLTTSTSNGRATDQARTARPTATRPPRGGDTEASRRQARSVLVRITPLAQTLDESVEVVPVQNLIRA